MEAFLPDTSLCIAALHGGADAVSTLRQQRPHAPVWLSAVVLEELYAGSSRSDRHVVARMERDFERVGRIMVPALRDWTEAGKVLARVGDAYGYEQIGRGPLTNDALIAVGAARKSLTVATANLRDFARLARFCPFRYELWKI